MSIPVGGENIFARPHKYEIIGRDKYKVDGGQIQSQGARGKSVTMTGTNLISKDFGQLVLTALQVSTATVRRLLIPVRMGMRMIHVRMIKVRMIHVRMIKVRMILAKIIHVRMINEKIIHVRMRIL